MESITILKDRALESLEGKWRFGAIATIIMFLISGVPYAALECIYTSLGNVWQIALLPLGWGFAMMWLTLARGEETQYDEMFSGYKDFSRVFITMLLTQIYTFLWTLLLIVPGIIKSYSYAMTPYILRDEPEMRYDAAIEKSMRIMDGHKMELFLLDLSFIGWAILCIISLGIGLIFLLPYYYTTRANFYINLKEELTGEVTDTVQ